MHAGAIFLHLVYLFSFCGVAWVDLLYILTLSTAARTPLPTRKRITDMRRKEPMTAEEARENIAAMKAETNPKAMQRLIAVALGPLGNLSDEAKAVYMEAAQ
jgi:hypothetical protein